MYSAVADATPAPQAAPVAQLAVSAPAAVAALHTATPTAVHHAVKAAAKPVHAKAVHTVKAPTHVTRPAVVSHRTAPKPVVQVSKPAPKPIATVAPKPVGDAYPYKYATTNALDPWGFTERQCVSYVAWRLAQAGRPLSNAGNVWGSALNWDDAARSHGKTVSSTPRVGSVAQWNAGESSAYYANGSSTPNGTFAAGGYGHVGYVTYVYSDGSVQISQYNGMGDRSYSSMHVKAPRYLYL